MNIYSNDTVKFIVWSKVNEHFYLPSYDAAVNKALDLAKNGADTVWIDLDVMNKEGNSGFRSPVSILRDDMMEIIRPRYTKKLKFCDD